MANIKINAELLRDMVEELILDGEYSYYGIRIDDNDYEIGDTCENSHVWDNGDWTDEELDGACAIALPEQIPVTARELDKVVELASVYSGKHIYIIGGDSKDYGEDAGEIIIRDAAIVAEL